MGRQRYDDDPATVAVPLAVEEAVWVADNPSSITSKDKARHFASRAAATAQQVRELRVNFDNELRRRTAASPNRGVQSTMSPEAAVRFLAPEQLAKLFDRLGQEKLAALEDMRARTERQLAQQQAVLTEMNRIVADAALDATVDEQTRGKLVALRDRILEITRTSRQNGQQL